MGTAFFIPDLRTILVMTIFVFAIQGGFFFQLYKIRRRYPFALLAVGCAAFSLGYVFYFLRPVVGYTWLTVSVANLLILSYPVFLQATLMAWHGVRRPVRAVWWALPGMLILLGATIAYQNDNLFMVIVASTLNGLYYLFIAGYVARVLPLGEPSMRMTLVSNVLLGIVLFGRAGVAYVMYTGMVSGQAAPTVAVWLSYTLLIALFCLSAQIYGLPLQEFTRAERSLRHLASVDPLTDVLNRRSFFALAEDVLPRHPHSTVLMLDLDRFKSINDRYGHPTGDRVIVAFARLLRDALRRDDVLGRMGGEEFAIVLPGSTPTHGADVAERIRLACEQVEVFSDDGVRVFLTVSIGMAQADGRTCLEDLLKLADGALYQAKEQGRNRVVVIGQAA